MRLSWANASLVLKWMEKNGRMAIRLWGRLRGAACRRERRDCYGDTCKIGSL